MPNRSSIGSVALAAALLTTIASAQAFDETKYPDWKGQWVRIGAGGQYDPTKPPGRRQQPPLTPEYQAVWEANLGEARAGGQPMEIIVTQITYMEISFNNEFRRIYTDGRDWPKDQEPTYSGYSIGKWVDEDGDGRYDMLEVETRGMKGSRIFDPSGIPLHKDNQTIVKERMFLDKTDPNILRDEMTAIDHALTRPWTVTRGYRRIRNPT